MKPQSIFSRHHHRLRSQRRQLVYACFVARQRSDLRVRARTIVTVGDTILNPCPAIYQREEGPIGIFSHGDTGVIGVCDHGYSQVRLVLRICSLESYHFPKPIINSRHIGSIGLKGPWPR